MFNGTCRDCILPYLVSLLPFCYPYVLLTTEISSETTPLTFQQNYHETLNSGIVVMYHTNYIASHVNDL